MSTETSHRGLLPVVAIVGRPNVGKSTLFNCLTRTRDAIVAEVPGLTRDRQYGIGRLDERACLLVDTGGLTGQSDAVARAISSQAERAIEESDAVVLVVDGREGLTVADEQIATRLRRAGRPVIVTVNKSESLDAAVAAGEFHALGFERVRVISAAHRRGTKPLLAELLALVSAEPPETGATEPEGVTVSIVGRPNVGKSTLVNRLLGEERVLAHDVPGTTRDSIRVPFRWRGRRYTLVDTAGIRRRARVSNKIEKFSVIKALQAIEACNVVVMLLDAREGVTDQDAGLLGMVLETGRAVTVAVNKWDSLGAEERRSVRAGVRRKLRFLDFAAVHYVSALEGRGLGALLASVDEAWASASRKLATPALSAALAEAVERNPPPAVRGRRIKLRYAHQGGTNPPVVVVHGNQTEAVPESYRRYLARALRERFALRGTPLRLEFKSTDNPYKLRRNVLTPRQMRRRQRIARRGK